MEAGTKEMKRLEKGYSAYMIALGAMDRFIYEHLDPEEREAGFDTSVFNQSGDGFVVQYDIKNAPLDGCLEIISEKGVLMRADYLDICI